MAKTVVSVYNELSEARDAIQDLVKAGFARDSISLVARDVDGQFAKYFEKQATPVNEGPSSDEGEGAIAGGLIGGLVGTLLGLGMLTIPGIGPILAAGPLATALLGAGAGTITGSLVGSIVEWDVPENKAEYYTEQLRQGKTLVCVTTSDDQADHAASILKRHHPVEVE